MSRLLTLSLLSGLDTCNDEGSSVNEKDATAFLSLEDVLICLGTQNA